VDVAQAGGNTLKAANPPSPGRTFRGPDRAGPVTCGSAVPVVIAEASASRCQG
jgi:hypothetical protein